jgi:hypothetical protein
LTEAIAPGLDLGALWRTGSLHGWPSSLNRFNCSR